MFHSNLKMGSGRGIGIPDSKRRGRFGTWRLASGGRGGPDAARTGPGRAPDAAGPVPDGRAPDDAGLPDEKFRTGHSPTDD